MAGEETSDETNLEISFDWFEKEANEKPPLASKQVKRKKKWQDLKTLNLTLTISCKTGKIKH